MSISRYDRFSWSSGSGIRCRFFILIAIEAIHRTYASLLGALVFVLLGAVSPEDILARDFIDIEILAVVLGLFFLVRGAERSGLFQFLAVKIMRISRSPTAYAVILLSLTFFLAIFVSNIGAMLIMASITILYFIISMGYIYLRYGILGI